MSAISFMYLSSITLSVDVNLFLYPSERLKTYEASKNNKYFTFRKQLTPQEEKFQHSSLQKTHPPSSSSLNTTLAERKTMCGRLVKWNYLFRYTKHAMTRDEMTKNNMQPTSSASEVSYILAYCSQTSFCLSKAKKSVTKRMNIYNNARLRKVCFLYTVIGPENSRQPPNLSDANKSQSRLGHSCFPALPAACLFSFEFSLARIEIIPLFWLAVVITLVLVLRHSMDMHSMRAVKELSSISQRHAFIADDRSNETIEQKTRSKVIPRVGTLSVSIYLSNIISEDKI